MSLSQSVDKAFSTCIHVKITNIDKINAFIKMFCKRCKWL